MAGKSPAVVRALVSGGYDDGNTGDTHNTNNDTNDDTNDDDLDSNELFGGTDDEEDEEDEHRSTQGGKQAIHPVHGGKQLARVMELSQKRPSPWHDDDDSDDDGSGPYLEDNMDVIEEMNDLRSKVEYLEKQIALNSSNVPGIAKDKVYQWQSLEARSNRPSARQMQILIESLLDKVHSYANRQSIASILKMSFEVGSDFVRGAVKIDLTHAEVLFQTLWQLWAFAVADKPEEECKYRLREGDVEFVRPYNRAVTAATMPIYFDDPLCSCDDSSDLPHFRLPALPPPIAPPPPSPSPFSSTFRNATTATPAMDLLALASPASQSAMSARRDESSDSLGELVGFSTTSPQPHDPHALKIADAKFRFEERFRVSPTPSWVSAARAYLEEVQRGDSLAIAMADQLEDQALAADLAPPSRQPNAEHPPWSMEGFVCADAVQGKDGCECRKCGDGGLLTECSGCGFSFHAACCDAARPVPGGDTLWFCGQDSCAFSAFRRMIGWRAKSVPSETFTCAVCMEDCNVGVKAKLIGCPCTGSNATCLSCTDELIVAREFRDTVKCPTCRRECPGLHQEGYDDRMIADIDFIEPVNRGGDASPPSPTAVVRRVQAIQLERSSRVRRGGGGRRGWVAVELQRMQTERFEAAVDERVSQRLASGNLSPDQAMAAMLASRNVEEAYTEEVVGEMDDDQRAALKAEAEARSRNRGADLLARNERRRQQASLQHQSATMSAAAAAAAAANEAAANAAANAAAANAAANESKKKKKKKPKKPKTASSASASAAPARDVFRIKSLEFSDDSDEDNDDAK